MWMLMISGRVTAVDRDEIAVQHDDNGAVQRIKYSGGVPPEVAVGHIVKARCRWGANERGLPVVLEMGLFAVVETDGLEGGFAATAAQG